ALVSYGTAGIWRWGTGQTALGGGLWLGRRARGDGGRSSGGRSISRGDLVGGAVSFEAFSAHGHIPRRPGVRGGAPESFWLWRNRKGLIELGRGRIPLLMPH